jgi:hypothetical protein
VKLFEELEKLAFAEGVPENVRAHQYHPAVRLVVNVTQQLHAADDRGFAVGDEDFVYFVEDQQLALVKRA